jgi:hypothetical protein
MKPLSTAIIAIWITLFTTCATHGIVLNEIKANPDGTDNPWEYVELIGVASENIANVYLVVIDGNATGAGTCRLVVPIWTNSTGGLLPSTPANPLMLVRGAGGHSAPESVTIFL